MSDEPKPKFNRDARVEELAFLTKFTVLGDGIGHSTYHETADSPKRRMMIDLVREGILNDAAGTLSANASTMGGFIGHVDSKVAFGRDLVTMQLLTGQDVQLTISHKGRVRMAELEQQLQTGRIKEPFGILYDQRYWQRDLTIALLRASKTEPVSCAFFDINDMKKINEVSHAAGDDALRAYFSVIAENVEGTGEAFRRGGDEVLAVLQQTSEEDALNFARRCIDDLAKRKVGSLGWKLTASAGVATGFESSSDVGSRADKEEARAKTVSKEQAGRPSVICEGGRAPEIVG